MLHRSVHRPEAAPRASWPSDGHPTSGIDRSVRTAEGTTLFHPSCPSFTIETRKFEKVLLRAIRLYTAEYNRTDPAAEASSIRSRRWHRRLPMAIWNPGQVATKHVDGQGRRHQNRSYPEAPVTMHAPPIWTRARFAAVATISLMVMPVSCHFVSISCEYSPRRAA